MTRSTRFRSKEHVNAPASATAQRKEYRLDRKKFGIDYRSGTYLALGAILGLALVLRLFRLDKPLIYSDEAFSWRVSTCDGPDLVERVAGDTHPIGFFLILKAWLEMVGTSPVEMRMLSVTFGLATVLMVFQLCVDATNLQAELAGRGRGGCQPTRYFGPLFASSLIAIHASQLDASRIVRMYSLAALLAAASSWCLLKALYADTRQVVWWTAYVAIAVTSLHTHNYALFMVAAQFLYVVLVLGGVIDSRWNAGHAARFKLAFTALCSVALLYSPWLPIFLRQAARVHQNFWLPEISLSSVAQSFVTWMTGLRDVDPNRFAAFWITFLLVMAVYTVRRRDEIGLFLLLQALIPWICTLLISTLSGRPLLDERYLVFSQVAIISYWGYMLTQLPTETIRGLVALNLLVPVASGTYDYIASIPVQRPSIINAVAFMRDTYEPGDVIIAPEPRDLNIFKYYASQADWYHFDIRCPRVENESGHVNHVSALSPDDWLWRGDLPNHVRRIWTINRPAWDWTDEWTVTWSKFYDPMDRTWHDNLLIRRFEHPTSSD